MIMNDKPFGCKHDGCDMTFANEDHLHVHQKRHEMVLNVGLANKNNTFADQTPTPTRFIRNCEEVGLFQDLQNVNPFDETFKKAIDHSKSADSLFATNPSSDDTLHTPHIFPHIIEATSTKTTLVNDISSTISAELDSDSPLDQSDDLIIIDDSEEEHGNRRTLKNDSKQPAPKQQKQGDIIPDKKTALKEKLRERLQTRTSISSNASDSPVTPVEANEKLWALALASQESVITNTNQSVIVHKQIRSRHSVVRLADAVVSSSTENAADLDEDVQMSSKDEERKLRNRVAQSRSRMRKKMHYNVLNGQLQDLQCQADELKSENKVLKEQMHELKKYILSHHEKCAFTGDMTFLKKCLCQPDKFKPAASPAMSKKRKLLPAPTKPVKLAPSNPIIVSVPPIKIPAGTPRGVKYIVLTPPPS